MATIKVRVQGEIATNLTPEVKLVCQNEKYDVEFEFDESWANSNFKTALFIYNGQLIAIPFDGTICKIPALYETELLHIGVKSNDVVGLHTTTPAKVVYLLSANDLTSNKIPEPSKDVYDEIIALLNKYISGGGSIDLSDYQKKIDENLPTTNKTIVGAIAEVKEIAETAKMVFGETEGTAYEGNKGKANADNIAKLQNELSIVNVALEQSGLVKKYKQPIEQEYNERVTADGLNVLDGSKAILKKVEGSTVACKQLFDIDSLVYTSNLATNANGKLIFDNSTSSGGKYFATASVTAIKLKPNTTYTSRCKFKATLVNSGGQSGGSMSRTLRLQTNAAYDANAIFIFGDTKQYDGGDNLEGVIYSKFTTPADLSEYKYLVTRNTGYSIKEFSELMLVEGEYTESNFPEYQPYFTGLKSASFGGIESGGRNLFDGTLLSGYYNAADFTLEAGGSTIFRSLRLNLPAGEYRISFSVPISFVRFIANGVLTQSGNYTFSTNGGEVGFSFRPEDRTDWKDEYKVWITAGTEETEYTPYISPYLYEFPKTETPLGVTIDFENKKITKEYEYLEQSTPFTEEQLTSYTDYIISKDGKSIMYKLSTPIETPFTAQQSASGNEYTAYKNGTEKVLDNDGNDYRADNTLTQDYILVTAVE